MSVNTTVEIPRHGTRGVSFPRMPGVLMRFMNRMTFRIFRNRGFRGAPGVLSLTTTGARSGQPRNSTLAYFDDGSKSWLIVASGGGTASNPAWLHNLAKHPDQAWAEIGSQKVRVTPETLQGDERAQAWKRITTQAPAFKSYETSTDREIAVIRLRAV